MQSPLILTTYPFTLICTRKTYQPAPIGPHYSSCEETCPPVKTTPNMNLHSHHIQKKKQQQKKVKLQNISNSWVYLEVAFFFFLTPPGQEEVRTDKNQSNLSFWHAAVWEVCAEKVSIATSTPRRSREHLEPTWMRRFCWIIHSEVSNAATLTFSSGLFVFFPPECIIYDSARLVFCRCYMSRQKRIKVKHEPSGARSTFSIG